MYVDRALCSSLLLHQYKIKLLLIVILQITASGEQFIFHNNMFPQCCSSELFILLLVRAVSVCLMQQAQLSGLQLHQLRDRQEKNRLDDTGIDSLLLFSTLVVLYFNQFLHHDSLVEFITTYFISDSSSSFSKQQSSGDGQQLPEITSCLAEAFPRMTLTNLIEEILL